MKVIVKEDFRWIMGDDSCGDLLKGKAYNVIEVDACLGWYCIADESGECWFYPPELFDIVEE